MRSDMCCTFYLVFFFQPGLSFWKCKNDLAKSDDHRGVMTMSRSVSHAVYARRGQTTGSDFKN